MSYLGEPRVEIMNLWREFGGSQHGPRVETVTMPMERFGDFIAEVERRARKSALDHQSEMLSLQGGPHHAD